LDGDVVLLVEIVAEFDDLVDCVSVSSVPFVYNMFAVSPNLQTVIFSISTLTRPPNMTICFIITILSLAQTSVDTVLTSCRPSQIGYVIVGLYLVYVIDHLFLFWVWNESQRNQAMTRHQFLRAFISL
jgi:hypothetical protein